VSDDLEFLSVRQVMAELPVGESVVWDLIRKGTSPARRSEARAYEIERGMFERWIRDQYATTRLLLLAIQMNS
jgi:hypothetical protein